jgi:uncharacterized protein
MTAVINENAFDRWDILVPLQAAISTKEDEMPLSKELLDILACPKCKGDIFLNRAGDGLICKTCRLIYPIKDDIPVMLIDEALPYQGEE